MTGASPTTSIATAAHASSAIPGAHFTVIDTIVLLAYFGLTLAIGFHQWRKGRDSDHYTTGGRSLPGWAVGLSIFGTYISSITFLANPGQSFATNWSLWVFSLSLPICTPIAVRWFLPYYRHSGHVSAYAMLEERFGVWARLYAAIFFMIAHVVRIGMVSYLLGLAMQIVLGWDVTTIIIVTGVVTTAYAFVGGIVAVVWTDVVQSFVLLGGALFSLVFILFKLPHGPGQLFTLAADAHKFSMGPYSASLVQQTFWIVLINGICTNFANFGIDQNFVQRYIISKSEREARKSIWLGAMLYVPASALFFLIGTALYAYYRTHVGELPPAVAGKADRVYAYFIVSALPPGVTGLLLAAIFAAAMSTLGACLNSFATNAHSDIYQRLINRNATERKSMFVLHAMTIVAGIAGTGVAILCAHTNGDTVITMWWKWSGILSGGTLGLFLLGFLSRRAGNAAAVVALAVGTAAFAWMTICKSFPDAVPAVVRFKWHDLTIATTGTLITLLAGFVASAVLPASRRAAESRRLVVARQREADAEADAGAAFDETGGPITHGASLE